MKAHLFILVVLLGVSLASSAAPETFAGEDDLITRLPPQELATYLELKILMNPLQMRHYLTQPTARARRAWIERFWIELDPTPATEMNERRLEHERRVLIARSQFPSPKTPGWDDRGETIVRWGFPGYRTKTPGSVGLHGVVPPGEIWYYDTYDMLIKFKDFTLTNTYWIASGAMRHAWTPADERKAGERLSRRAETEEGVLSGPAHYLDPEDFKNVLNNTDPDEIDYWSDPAIAGEAASYSGMKDLIAEIEYDRIGRVEGYFDKFINDRPVLHTCDLVQNTLPLYFDVTTFRDGDRRLRAEINFEVPSSEILFAPAGAGGAADVEFRAIVRDYDFKTIAYGADSIRPEAPGEGFAPSSLLPGQVILSLEPGYYRVGVEAFDRNSRKSAAATRVVRIDPCTGSPAISDIQFASAIRDAGENAAFTKGNLQVVPHPERGYRIPTPVDFYFEIYRLDTDREGVAFFRVEYRIVPLEKRRWGPVLIEVPATISSTFETSAQGATQPGRLSIETSELWEGRFRLDVTITDRRTFRTATRSAEFSIVR